MKAKTAKTTDWQIQGGEFNIPDGWFVNYANFDVEEPFIQICKESSVDEDKIIHIPKALAYYLSTHFCGSEYMKELIEEHAVRGLQNNLKNLLGL